MKILILGSDGFIGYHLSESILKDPRFANAEIVGVDLYNNRTHMLPQDNRLKFYQFNILNDTTTVDKLIEECDVILPFVFSTFSLESRPARHRLASEPDTIPGFRKKVERMFESNFGS